jgi:hypothetical protein
LPGPGRLPGPHPPGQAPGRFDRGRGPAGQAPDRRVPAGGPGGTRPGWAGRAGPGSDAMTVTLSDDGRDSDSDAARRGRGLARGGPPCDTASG